MDSRVEPDLQDAYASILLLGYTGSGMSTLINYLVNKQMISKKISGCIRLDVAEGESYPPIGHRRSLSKTQFPIDVIDEDRKIIYCDTPGISSTHYELKKTELKEIISNKILEYEAKKGAIILVFNYVILQSSTLHSWLQELRWLYQHTNIMNLPILFVVTDNYTKDITHSDIIQQLKVIQESNKDIPLLNLMTQPENLICAEMLENKTREEIHQWIFDS